MLPQTNLTFLLVLDLMDYFIKVPVFSADGCCLISVGFPLYYNVQKNISTVKAGDKEKKSLSGSLHKNYVIA